MQIKYIFNFHTDDIIFVFQFQNSLLRREEEELKKIKSGMGAVILKDLKEHAKYRKWKQSHIDPRNASRTPSASKELMYRLRYESPIGNNYFHKIYSLFSSTSYYININIKNVCLQVHRLLVIWITRSHFTMMKLHLIDQLAIAVQLADHLAQPLVITVSSMPF